MKENFELIEYGVLMEAEKNGKDLSVIDWPVNCNERQFAEQLLADELKLRTLLIQNFLSPLKPPYSKKQFSLKFIY